MEGSNLISHLQVYTKCLAETICEMEVRAINLEWFILFGSRVLVPPPGRKQLLLELHQGHSGISRIKSS